MTTMLQKAVERALALPEKEQDALAAILVQEMESETRWEKALADSQDALAELAREATDEFKSGIVRPFDTDSL